MHWFEGSLSWVAGTPPGMIWLQAASPLQNPLVPIILMVVIFYLVLFLPMRRRQRKLDNMLANLKNGDRVVTNGGLVGTIVSVGEDNSVTLRIKPDNVKLQFARNAITAMMEEEQKS